MIKVLNRRTRCPCDQLGGAGTGQQLTPLGCLGYTTSKWNEDH